MKRKIIRIDESKCDGCGLCATACAEGAIKIMDGRPGWSARLTATAWAPAWGNALEGR